MVPRYHTVVFAIAMVALSPQLLLAYMTGIAGYSGKQGSICTACHSGGKVPSVAFSGPSMLAPGASADFTFTVTSNGPSQVAAGFNVAASAGALAVIVGQGSQLCDPGVLLCNGVGQELTHTTPKRNNLSHQASWKFKWTAPLTADNYILWGAGNSVNLNQTTSNDNAASTMIVIAVGGVDTVTPTVPSTPSPTRTLSPTPASSPSTTTSPTDTPTNSPAPTDTPTETATATASPTDSTTQTPVAPSSTTTSTPTASPTGTDTPTATATPTQTFSSSATNTPTPTATVLVSTPTRTPSAAIPGDANCDQRVSAADLTEFLLQLAAGSPARCGADANADGTLDEADIETITDLLFGP
jgi:hypothetical protein